MGKRGLLEKNRDQSGSLIRDFYASSDQVVHKYADVSGYSPFFTRIRGGLFEGSVDGKQFAFKHALQIERRSFSQVKSGGYLLGTQKRGLLINKKGSDLN